MLPEGSSGESATSKNLIIGASLATSGTFKANTSAAKWIGFQVLAGARFGLAWQPSRVAAQASVKQADIGPATSVVLCKSGTLGSPACHGLISQTVLQTLGAAIFISAGECAFANQLVRSLRRLVPDVDPYLILSSDGAITLTAKFSDVTLGAIRRCYLDGL